MNRAFSTEYPDAHVDFLYRFLHSRVEKWLIATAPAPPIAAKFNFRIEFRLGRPGMRGTGRFLSIVFPEQLVSVGAFQMITRHRELNSPSQRGAAAGSKSEFNIDLEIASERLCVRNGSFPPMWAETPDRFSKFEVRTGGLSPPRTTMHRAQCRLLRSTY